MAFLFGAGKAITIVLVKIPVEYNMMNYFIGCDSRKILRGSTNDLGVILREFFWASLVVVQ